ncbi:MAG TPA: hypothetical protein VIK95_05050 [Egibacteraceae bacterium]
MTARCRPVGSCSTKASGPAPSRRRRARALLAVAVLLAVVLGGAVALAFAAFGRRPSGHPGAFLEAGGAAAAQAVVVAAGSSTTAAS